MRIQHLAIGLGLLVASCVGKGLPPDSETGGTPSPASGGVLSAGGSGGGGSTAPSATGGSTIPRDPASSNCKDTSSTAVNLTTQFGGTFIAVDGSPDKNYRLNPNWWNSAVPFNRQTIKVDGLSFLVGNPANATSPNHDPVGYPAIFIGTYAGFVTKGSNLPKKVSDIKRVSTVFDTNSLSKGRVNFNAAYDIWFTPTAAPLRQDQYQPPPGGAFIMVWYFKPDNRQPRGSIRYPAHEVNGIPGTWNVWIDNTNPPCISYVNTTPVESMDFDLNRFIQDSVDNAFGITREMYLSLVFAGFEIWGGGDGLQAKAFCASVE